MRPRFVIPLALLLILGATLTHFARAAELGAAGYSIELDITPETSDQYLAKVTVRDARDTVLFAPAVRGKIGEALETESTGPGGVTKVTVKIEVHATGEAKYEIEVFDAGMRVARHRAKVVVGR